MSTLGRAALPARLLSLLALSAVSVLELPLARAEEAAASESSSVLLSEQRAAEAFQAYSRNEYAAAVALYLQAYEAAPSGSILYNIARIYDTKLADRPLAITFYRRYISDPGAYTERIEFANQRLKQLREAELLSSKLGATDSAPSSAASKAGNPAEPASPVVLAQQPGQRERGWSTLRWTGVGVGAFGIAALGVGAGFGLAAMSKAGTAKNLCDGDACMSQGGVDAANSANDAATVANIGFLGGGALLAAGVTLFVLGAEQSSERRPTAALRWQPQLSPSGAALQVSRTW